MVYPIKSTFDKENRNMFKSEHFELGKQVITHGVNEAIKESTDFTMEVCNAMTRYCNMDWGDLCKEDKEMNTEALCTGERLFAAYHTCKGKIYIITEWDRSVTTVLFADEY